MDNSVVFYLRYNVSMQECKTRWHTLIQNPIKIVLRQLMLSDLWKEEYYEFVREILNCLKPVRSAVESLCNDANLLTREGILSFFFLVIWKNNSALSSMLLKEIRNELLKCRNKGLVSLIKYLSNVSCLHEVEKDGIFALANNNEIARLAKSLIERLYKGKRALTEEMQREENVNVVVEYSDMK
jgi:hypothetical protein